MIIHLLLILLLGLSASSAFAQNALLRDFQCQDAGANDTYACALPITPGSYVTGQRYLFKANTANTGPATVNFNTLGAVAIKKAVGGVTSDLADNDIRAGQWVYLVYDGTNMQMLSHLGNAAEGGGDITQTDLDNRAPARGLNEFAGATLGAKLEACSASFATSPDGGVCDARGITGAQAISSNLTIAENGVAFLFASSTTITVSPGVQILLSGDNIQWLGAGDGTHFDASAGTSAIAVISVTGDGITLKDFQMTGNRTAGGTATLITSTATDKLTIESVKLNNAGYAAILTETTTNFLARNNTIVTPTNRGIYCQSGCTGWRVENNHITGDASGVVGDAAIGMACSVTGGGFVCAADVWVTDNYIKNTGIVGIRVGAAGASLFPTNVHLHRNTIDGVLGFNNVDGEGITGGPHGATYLGNRINNCWRHGIQLFNHASDVTVVGNVISNVNLQNTGPTNNGITLHLGSTSTCFTQKGHIIVGNTIYDDQVTPTTAHGIGVSDSCPAMAGTISNTRIAHNTVRNTTQQGIRCVDPTDCLNIDIAPPHNYTQATAAPTVNDDADDGWLVGSEWYYAGVWYKASDVTVGAAVWEVLGGIGGSGITTLNALTATTQTFATGTTGTDFGIASATSTHTFNLPVASATNTGKLSSTDWATFNAKADPLSRASTQFLAIDDAIDCSLGYVIPICGSSDGVTCDVAYTLTSNPQILAGTFAGQSCLLEGANNAGPITLNTGAGIQLRAEARTISVDGDGNPDQLELIWTGTVWLETATLAALDNTDNQNFQSVNDNSGATPGFVAGANGFEISNLTSLTRSLKLFNEAKTQCWLWYVDETLGPQTTTCTPVAPRIKIPEDLDFCIVDSAGAPIACFDEATKATTFSGTVNVATGSLQEGGVDVSLPARTETLTNKTISGASNTLTNIPNSALSAAMKVRTCQIAVGDPDTASPVLLDGNDTPAVCRNETGTTLTITAVRCYANAGSPTVTPIVTGGAGTSILSGALTCGTGSYANGSLNGTPTLSAGASVDANITAAGGTAKYIVIVIAMTL